MQKILMTLCALAVLSGCAPGESGSQVAVNPITYTDIPDSDIIRVGNDFYMVSTTMFFCPGAPIMHSRDLVHWRIVNYIYDVLEDDDIYNLRDGRNAYGKGQWATTLRFHDGVYYALFVANDQQKTYLYKTRDIENGTWTRNEIEGFFMHDASLLFDDDGRFWVAWGNGEIHLVELEPDGSGVKAGAQEKVIIDSPREGWMLRAEGSHLYHLGDWYYLLEIDWPRGGVRTATCWRSRSVEGPYESKVVLQGTLGGLSHAGIAQGPIVDTPRGDWYAIQFQDHGAVGRIPTIQRVTWVDEWPILGNDTVPEEEVTVNLKADGEDWAWDSDEFESDQLALVWQWNHKAPEGWSLTERLGWLKLASSACSVGLSDARGTLTQRTVGPRCISEVRLDVSDLAPGDEAGICAFQSRSARVGVEVTPEGRMLTLREKEEILSQTPLEGDSVYLRIRYVFTPVDEGDAPDTAFFSWSSDGETWTEFDFALKMRFTLDYFTGYRTGLYCFHRSGPGGSAWFDYFHQQVY